jgi:hypothetical protein
MKKTDEKPLKYSLMIETDSGRCQIATDNWQLLINLIDPFACIDKNFADIKTAAKRAQIAYHQSHKHENSQSPIAQDDNLEIEVISYYLKGWDTLETTAWLNKKGHKVSKSAIGRYWTRLRNIGIFRMYRYKDKKPLKINHKPGG